MLSASLEIIAVGVLQQSCRSVTTHNTLRCFCDCHFVAYSKAGCATAVWQLEHFAIAAYSSHTVASAEEAAPVAPTSSASAGAIKSILRMLSLKQKPPVDANLPDEEAAQRQISAQLALAREVSEPAVIMAASDDNLQRPPELLQSAAASEADTDSADTKAASLAKQPSSMAKRFSFLTSLRRGQTLPGSGPHVDAQLSDIPETLTQQPQCAATTDVSSSSTMPMPAVAESAGLQANTERAAANLIELPPVFEYGSEAESPGSPQHRSLQSRDTIVVDTQVDLLHAQLELIASCLLPCNLA